MESNARRFSFRPGTGWLRLSSRSTGASAAPRWPLVLVVFTVLVLVVMIGLERLWYPLHYEAHIRSTAERTGLDPTLLAAVVRTESRFRAGARSHAGAVGLMQLLPATAEWVAQRHGLEGYHPGWLTDPEGNLLVGGLYLAELLDRYRGDEVAALAAYNAGPSAADAWMADESGLSSEAIVYPETRSYVSEVLMTRQTFARLYPHLDPNHSREEARP